MSLSVGLVAPLHFSEDWLSLNRLAEGGRGGCFLYSADCLLGSRHKTVSAICSPALIQCCLVYIFFFFSFSVNSSWLSPLISGLAAQRHFLSSRSLKEKKKSRKWKEYSHFCFGCLVALMSSYIGLQCGGRIQTKAETTVYIHSMYIYTLCPALFWLMRAPNQQTGIAFV